MKFELYRDLNHQYRWRLRASNGKIIADSAEGYRYKRGALRGIEIARGSSRAPIFTLGTKPGEWVKWRPAR